MTASPEERESYIWELLQQPRAGCDDDSETAQFDLLSGVAGLPETPLISWEDRRRLLTPEQMAYYLGISVATVHQLCRIGKLGYVRVALRGDRRFTHEQLEDFIRAHSIERPKQVDPKDSNKVRSPRKGGEKLSGDSVRTQLREDVCSWLS